MESLKHDADMQGDAVNRTSTSGLISSPTTPSSTPQQEKAKRTNIQV